MSRAVDLSRSVDHMPGPISDAEMAERVRLLQAMLADHDLDGLVCFGAHRDYCPADLRYLGRWSCTDEETSYIVVPAEGGTTLITDAEWDYERAQVEAYAADVVFDPSPERALSGLIGRSTPRARIGISGFRQFPAPVYLALGESCPQTSFVDASHITESQRRTKSRAELELLAEAARITDAGMQAGIEAVREGATESAVAAAAEYEIRRQGAELAFVTVMGSGPRTAQATFFPTNRVLQAGDCVVLDCGARVEGYHGDMCRSLTVGPPSERQRRALGAVESAVENAIDAARPGVSVGDVHRAARDAVVRAGFGENWWGYYMPHGTGAAQHEPPAGMSDEDLLLEQDMVICVEPGITLPGEGAFILEQMVRVTAEGAEPLTRLPLRFS
jgi:Xaa-Pro aminopeptidase